MLRIFVAFIALFFWESAHAKKVALVIGNSDYQSASNLRNPVNDALDIAQAFQKVGYEVEVQTDLTYLELNSSLRTFANNAADAKQAVIYFAGHGVEIDRLNYIIPTDAKLRTDIDVAYEAVPLEKLVRAVGGASDLSLVILDACRNNPFSNQMVRSAGTRSLGRGLAKVEPTGNTLVAFAAKEGTVAQDGSGRNSPFASAIVDAVTTPGLEVNRIFRVVRDDVLKQTGGQQEPFVYGSLSAQSIFLQDPPPKTEVDLEATASLQADGGIKLGTAEPDAGTLAVELAFWASIKESQNPEDFVDYLDRYKSGNFRSLAERRLALLQPDEPSRDIPEPPEDVAVDAPSSEIETVPPVSEPPAAAEAVSGTFDPSRTDIRVAQERLNVLGFKAGVVDGLAGRRTSQALAAYQNARGLGESGTLTLETLDRLKGEVSAERVAAYRSERAPAAAPNSDAEQTERAARPLPAEPAPQKSSTFVARNGFCQNAGGVVRNGANGGRVDCLTIGRDGQGIPIRVSYYRWDAASGPSVTGHRLKAVGWEWQRHKRSWGDKNFSFSRSNVVISDRKTGGTTTWTKTRFNGAPFQ